MRGIVSFNLDSRAKNSMIPTCFTILNIILDEKIVIDVTKAGENLFATRTGEDVCTR